MSLSPHQRTECPAQAPHCPDTRQSLGTVTSVVDPFEELRAIRTLLDRSRTHEVHPSVVSITQERLVAIIELRANELNSVHTTSLTHLHDNLSAYMMDRTVHFRTVQIDMITDLAALQQIRTLYLQYPSLRSILCKEGSFGVAAPDSTPGAIDEITSIKSALSKIFNREFSVKEPSKMELPYTSAHSLPDEVTSALCSLWGRADVGVVANQVIVHPEKKTLLVVDERVAGKKIRNDKASSRYQEQVPNFEIVAEIDFTMPDLRAHLSHLRDAHKIRDFQIAALETSTLVRLLIPSRDNDAATKACYTLSRALKKSVPGALLVDGVASDSPYSEFCFKTVPAEWRLESFSVSASGDSIRLHQRPHHRCKLADAARSQLEQRFPGGVWANEREGYAPVDKTDALFIRAIGILPTRHNLRRMEQCTVTEEIVMHMVGTPEADVMRDLQHAFQRPVKIKQAPRPFRNYMVKPPLDLLEEYGDRIPYFPHPEGRGFQFQGFGACRSVGGSSHFLNIAGFGANIDFGGTFQGVEPIQIPQERIRQCKVGLITHPHADHVNRTMAVVQSGWDHPILMTEPTALAMYSLLQEECIRQSYPHRHLEDVYRLIRTVPFHIPISLTPFLKVTFYRASHAVGSASLRFEYDNPDSGQRFSVTHTGDFKCGENDLYPPIEIPPPSDILIGEGTYGVQTMPPISQEVRRLVESIKSDLLHGNTIIMPVLTYNRAQQVIMALDANRQWFVDNKFEIYLVGGLIDKNNIYGYVASDRPEEFSALAHTLRPWQYGTHSATSCKGESGYDHHILNKTTPKVIVVSGGMIVGHAEQIVRHYQDWPSAKLYVTCFQADGTLGRKIVDLQDGIISTIEELPRCNLRTERFQLSGHSDVTSSIDYYRRAVVPDGTLILVHGDEQKLLSLQERVIREAVCSSVLVPANLEQLSLLDG